MSASTIATTVTKLNEHNYRSWVLEMQDVLKQLGLWRLDTGTERVPVAPQASNSTDDEKYLQRYEKFETAHDQYEDKKTKACGTICRALEPSIRQRYRHSEFDDPKVLWDTIKVDFEEVIKLDGKHEQQKLATCKLELETSLQSASGFPRRTRSSATSQSATSPSRTNGGSFILCPTFRKALTG
jgi:hypothetical protein